MLGFYCYFLGFIVTYLYLLDVFDSCNFHHTIYDVNITEFVYMCDSAMSVVVSVWVSCARW
jgi:hypothetical protein